MPRYVSTCAGSEDTAHPGAAPAQPVGRTAITYSPQVPLSEALLRVNVILPAAVSEETDVVPAAIALVASCVPLPHGFAVELDVGMVNRSANVLARGGLPIVPDGGTVCDECRPHSTAVNPV